MGVRDVHVEECCWTRTVRRASAMVSARGSRESSP